MAMDNHKPSILVLGGFGFIGRHLVTRLVRDGFSVTVFGRPSHEGLDLAPGSPIRYCYGDFENASELDCAVRGMDVVFHLIGSTVPQSSNDNPRFDVDAHIGPTVTLLDLCVKNGVHEVVFASSGGTVYGLPVHLPIDENHKTAPISSYGIQKLAIEHYMRLYGMTHGLCCTVLRVANPYGPGQNIARHQGIIGTICSKIRRNETIDIWGDGKVVRDYIYISDLVEAMERCILSGDGYRIYNVGTGVGTEINRILEIFRTLGCVDLRVRYRPGRLVDIPANILDFQKIRGALNWQPQVALEDGIRLTLNSYPEKK